MNWVRIVAPTRERILRDGSENKSYVERWEQPLGNVLVNAPVYYCGKYDHRRIWDSVIPNYKRRRAAGETFCNDFLDASVDAEYTATTYTATGEFGGSSVLYSGSKAHNYPNWGADKIVAKPDNFFGAQQLISPDLGDLRAEAVTKAYSRVDVSELDVLASLGEMPETVEWFKDVLRRFINIIASYKKKQYLAMFKPSKPLTKAKLYKKGKKAASSTEDAWMEARYAIRPLVMEVKDYLEALDSKVETAIRKTARSSYIDLTSQESVSPSTRSFFGGYIRRKTTTTRSIRAGVLYAIQPDKMGWWSHLGLDAPVSAIWAVTTLSFVADWFFNVGQWIASWEPRVGLTPLQNWVVETLTQEIEDTVTIGTAIASDFGWSSLSSMSIHEVGSSFCTLQIKMRWANPDRQILPTFNFDGLKTAQIADLVIIGRKLTSQLFR